MTDTKIEVISPNRIDITASVQGISRFVCSIDGVSVPSCRLSHDELASLLPYFHNAVKHRQFTAPPIVRGYLGIVEAAAALAQHGTRVRFKSGHAKAIVQIRHEELLLDNGCVYTYAELARNGVAWVDDGLPCGIVEGT